MSRVDILTRIHDMLPEDTDVAAKRWPSRRRKGAWGISLKKERAA